MRTGNDGWASGRQMNRNSREDSIEEEHDVMTGKMHGASERHKNNTQQTRTTV